MSRRVALPSEEQTTFVPRAAESTVVHGRLDPRVEKSDEAAAA
jgi:hypothetical protein